MEIVLIILVVILVALNAFLLYKNEFKREKPVTKPKLTREEKEKQEQLRKSFDNLMNYDESIARSKRK